MNFKRTSVVQQDHALVPSAINRPFALQEYAAPCTSAQAVQPSYISDIDYTNISDKGLRINVIQGFLALCEYCGFCGTNGDRCERCKRIFIRPQKRILFKKINENQQQYSEQEVRHEPIADEDYDSEYEYFET